MASEDPGTPLSPAEDRARRRRQKLVLAGAFLTVAGLLTIAGTLPIAPGPLAHQLPLTGGGIFAAWLGGVLMGRSSGAAPRSPEK